MDINMDEQLCSHDNQCDIVSPTALYQINSLEDLIPFDERLDALRQLGLDNGVPVLQKVVEQFLQTMVSIAKPLRILEVGTGIGYSGMVLLKCASHDTTLTTVELNEQSFEIAKGTFAKYSKDKVNMINGDCRVVVPQLLEQKEQFDMIFMDGPKSAYYQLLDDFYQLLPQGGLLICDNVLLKGNIVGDRYKDFMQSIGAKKPSTIVTNLQKFVQAINDPIWTSTILDIADGVSLSVKK